jgi:hypothetical protein
MANSIVALTDTASQIAELQRRQKLAEALSAQGAAPIEVQSYKGIQAPISPLSGIAKVLQAYLGAKQSADIAKGDKEARQTARDEAVSYLESMKRTPDIGRFETPVSVEEARQQAAVPALTPVAPAGPPEMMQVGGVPTDMQGGVTPTASVQAPMPQVYSDAQPSAYMGPQATVMPGRERTPQERMAMALQAQMSGNEYAAAATKPEYERAVTEAADQAEVQRILNNPAVKDAPKEVKDKLTLISALGSTALKSAVGKMFEPEETTSLQRDYKAAVAQGYPGSFMDYVQFANPKTIAVTAGGQVYDTRALTGTNPPPTAQPAPTAGTPAAATPTANVPSIVENNNPGALEYRPWMKRYGAVVSEDGRFARFPTTEAGIQAQTALITNDYVNKGVNTIDAIVDKYLGKGSENSFESRSGYKTYLVQKTGLSLGQQVTAADIPKLTEAMRQFETGQRAPAPTAAPAPKGAPKPLVVVPPKPEPQYSEAQLKDLTEISKASNAITRAIELVNKAPNSFNFLRAVPGKFGGEMGEALAASNLDSPKAKQARYAVFNTVSAIILQRAGTAQTLGEREILLSFLPAKFDDQNAILTKLQGFQDHLVTQEKAVKDPTKPLEPSFGSSAKTTKAPAGIDQADWDVLTPEEKKAWK